MVLEITVLVCHVISQDHLTWLYRWESLMVSHHEGLFLYFILWIWFYYDYLLSNYEWKDEQDEWKIHQAFSIDFMHKDYFKKVSWKDVFKKKSICLLPLRASVSTKIRSSQTFHKICIFQKTAKLTGKHLYRGLFFNKVAGLQLYLESDFGTGVFLWILWKF